MILYIVIITVCTALIAVLNIVLAPFTTHLSILYCIIAAVVNTVCVILLDGLIAWLVRRMPEKYFSYENKIFYASEKECKFYRKLGIRKWRDKIPELGLFTGFSKGQVSEPDDIDYLKKFILEANYGSLGHIIGAFAGFLIIFIYPLKYAFCFGVLVAFVNFILCLLPAFVLRYNTPKLLTLIKRNLRRENKTKSCDKA